MSSEPGILSSEAAAGVSAAYLLKILFVLKYCNLARKLPFIVGCESCICWSANFHSLAAAHFNRVCLAQFLLCMHLWPSLVLFMTIKYLRYSRIAWPNDRTYMRNWVLWVADSRSLLEGVWNWECARLPVPQAVELLCVDACLFALLLIQAYCIL